MATFLPSAVEATRKQVGLSRPQIERLLSAYCPDGEDLDRFLSRLEKEHERFMAKTVETVHSLAGGRGWLSTSDVSQATGMGEFQVANLRRRGKLVADYPSGSRRYPQYPLESVLAFLHREPNFREHNSPLSWEFLRVLEEKWAKRPPISRELEAAGA